MVYLYRTLYTSIILANISVMPLAIIIGISLLNTPYNNHNKVPNAKREYMANDMPDVFFV